MREWYGPGAIGPWGPPMAASGILTASRESESYLALHLGLPSQCEKEPCDDTLLVRISFFDTFQTH